MDVIERAKRKREALLKELRRLDDFLKMADSLDAELQPVAGNGKIPAPETGAKSAKTLSNRARVEAAVAELIEKHGPMKKRDIFQRLTEMGISPGTSKPTVMLSILLSRSERFTNDKAKRVWRITKGRSPSGTNH